MWTTKWLLVYWILSCSFCFVTVGVSENRIFFPTVQFFAGNFMIYHGIGISSGNLTWQWEIPTLNLFNGRIWDSGSYSISRWIFNIVYFFQWEIPTFSITFLEGNPHLANLRTAGSRIVDLSKVLFISSAVVPWLWLWLWVIWNHGGWWSHLNTSSLWNLGGTTYFWILDWVCRRKHCENPKKIFGMAEGGHYHRRAWRFLLTFCAESEVGKSWSMLDLYFVGQLLSIDDLAFFLNDTISFTLFIDLCIYSPLHSSYYLTNQTIISHYIPSYPILPSVFLLKSHFFHAELLFFTAHHPRFFGLKLVKPTIFGTKLRQISQVSLSNILGTVLAGPLLGISPEVTLAATMRRPKIT